MKHHVRCHRSSQLGDIRISNQSNEQTQHLTVCHFWRDLLCVLFFWFSPLHQVCEIWLSPTLYFYLFRSCSQLIFLVGFRWAREFMCILYIIYIIHNWLSEAFQWCFAYKTINSTILFIIHSGEDVNMYAFLLVFFHGLFSSSALADCCYLGLYSHSQLCRRKRREKKILCVVRACFFATNLHVVLSTLLMMAARQERTHENVRDREWVRSCNAHINLSL